MMTGRFFEISEWGIFFGFGYMGKMPNEEGWIHGAGLPQKLKGIFSSF